jgi:hypothetical protein
LIAFPIRDGYIRVRWVGILMFFALLMLSITTEVLANISIVLIFSIIALTYLIPKKEILGNNDSLISSDLAGNNTTLQV